MTDPLDDSRRFCFGCGKRIPVGIRCPKCREHHQRMLAAPPASLPKGYVFASDDLRTDASRRPWARLEFADYIARDGGMADQ